MRLVLHGMAAIGMAGAVLALPVPPPSASPALSRLPDAGNDTGSQGGAICCGCPAGPGLGDAVWLGCRWDPDRGQSDRRAMPAAIAG